MLFKERIQEKEINIDKEKIAVYNDYLNERKIYKTDLIKEIAGLSEKGKVLEVGSQTGYIGMDILKNNYGLEVIALESNDELIQKAKENAAKENLLQSNWQVAKGGVESIPYEDRYFDLSVSINALHHWQDSIKAIKEIFRVTKKSGHIFINDLRRDAEEGIIEFVIRDLKARYQSENAWIPKLFIASIRASYLTDELREIAKEAGLKKFEVFQDGPISHTLKIFKEKNI